MFDIQVYFENLYLRLQAQPHYLKLMTLPTMHRWGVIGGVFLLSQILVLGSLYFLFD
jgi:ZIP family zinc transporter